MTRINTTDGFREVSTVSAAQTTLSGTVTDERFRDSLSGLPLLMWDTPTPNTEADWRRLALVAQRRGLLERGEQR